MGTLTWFYLSLLLLGETLVGQQTFPEFDRADQEIIRLLPAAFNDLPASIRRELERRKCTIPQVYSNRAHGNVVRGHFTRPNQTDIAVLCSRERVSSVLVFQNGSATGLEELASAPDLNYLQGIGNGRIGFSRELSVASPRYIQEHYKAYGGPEPPPLDHDGINDAFVEKASVVWYWYKEQWLRLTGAD
jgi:hypothetical protein